ncbi:MAG TPA: V-type ATPase 116kDa subunit family protein [Nitrososphaerales archaeon]|nr:V-type ATPase 116kDa subunit family protein [Nitrososphaerales archaeon]
MGVARLTKVSVISARSEYVDVAKALAKFKDFHPLENAQPNFDPKVQELTVRAVRLFSQADQAVKDLGLKVEPGWMDQVFKGIKIERKGFDAAEWDELLRRVEGELEPVVQEVRVQKSSLQKMMKDLADSQALRDALQLLSDFSVNLGGLRGLHRFKSALCIVPKATVQELKNSLPEGIFVSQSLNQQDDIVFVAIKVDDAAKLDRTLKALEIKPVSIPANFSQNPAKAYKQLTKDLETVRMKKAEVEDALAKISAASAGNLLAMRELSEVARELLDEARISGNMKRLATISGYIPAKKEAQFRSMFGRWIVYSEPIAREKKVELPVLFENKKGIRLWQLVTAEQGVPGNEEVDPTPLISFIFPIFFGLMFGDFGHGLIFTAFVLFVRQRVTGTKRQWANIFVITGVSSMIFGVLFGEFFGFSLYKFIPIPPVVEIIDRTGPQATPNITNIEAVMIVSIIIGIAHLVTGLGLDIYESAKAGERVELIVEKIPAIVMYVSGLGYGIAFIGAGFKFDVLSTSVVAPLVDIPVNVLGAVSLAALLPTMLVLFLGRAVAVKMGKLHGESFTGALSNGGLEVFEKILQFLSNTISYIRLAVMLLVHAVLLVIISPALTYMFPYFVPLWVIFNLLILALEGLIVYVQDLRLHVYEFFTKFYAGDGKPFRNILPERPRIRINWL